MFNTENLNITKEEEKEAIKQIIKSMIDTIAKNLSKNNYMNSEKQMRTDLMCLFAACHADFYGSKKTDILYKKMMNNFKSKYN